MVDKASKVMPQELCTICAAPAAWTGKTVTGAWASMCGKPDHMALLAFYPLPTLIGQNKVPGYDAPEDTEFQISLSTGLSIASESEVDKVTHVHWVHQDYDMPYVDLLVSVPVLMQMHRKDMSEELALWLLDHCRDVDLH